MANWQEVNYSYVRRHTITFAVVLFFVLFAWNVWSAAPAYAIEYNSSGIPPGLWDQTGYKSECQSSPADLTYGHGGANWISRLNDSLNINPVTIYQGQPTAELQFNVVSHHCQINSTPVRFPAGNINGKAITTTTTRIVSSSSSQPLTTVVGLDNNQLVTDYLPTYGTVSDPREYYYTKADTLPGNTPVNLPFDLSGLSILPVGDYSITITVQNKSYNTYRDPQPYPWPNVCTADQTEARATPTDPRIGSSCPIGSTDTTVFLRVLPPPPPTECNPATQTVGIGAQATFNAINGIGPYNWLAPGGMPGGGLGTSFSTTYNTVGRKTVTLTSANPTVTCEVIVGRRPYFRVNGGDVSVGAGFKNGASPCATKPDAGILAFNLGSNSGQGSGAQLAAAAFNIISGFSTASTRTAPGPSKGLSFSNTAGDTTYGGSFGTAPCIYDYINAPISSPGWNTTTSGTTNLGPMNVSPGTRNVYKINGNLVIAGDIKFDVTTPWTSLNDIPGHYVIVDGDIYIKKDVTQLDGVYIASGTIYSCVNPGGMPYSLVSLNQCNQRLTVNGAFIANAIKLTRTPGDVNDPASPAEEFNYSPEFFFASPFSSSGYESIVNLPPVL